MTQEWKWYAGSEDYIFDTGPFDTREECIEEARALGVEDFDGGIHVIEACKSDVLLSSCFDVHGFLDQADDRMFDQMGEDGGSLFSENITADQIKGLEAEIKLAIDHWQQHHNLTFTPWCFHASRNHAYIIGGEDEE